MLGIAWHKSIITILIYYVIYLTLPKKQIIENFLSVYFFNRNTVAGKKILDNG